MRLQLRSAALVDALLPVLSSSLKARRTGSDECGLSPRMDSKHLGLAPLGAGTLVSCRVSDWAQHTGGTGKEPVCERSEHYLE